jgi:hypothetical protein
MFCMVEGRMDQYYYMEILQGCLLNIIDAYDLNPFCAFSA